MSDVPDFIFVQRLALGGGGPRVGIKDSIDIAGCATRMGSACLADAPPAPRHAAVVQALLEAGCRIVGKTNMHELAYGVTGINRWSGTPVNPRAPDRVPGGSSSGSAVAVAAGVADFTLGNDTGGSIRIPAACCGVYGLKPTVRPGESKRSAPGRVEPRLCRTARTRGADPRARHDHDRPVVPLATVPGARHARLGRGRGRPEGGGRGTCRPCERRCRGANRVAAGVRRGVCGRPDDHCSRNLGGIRPARELRETRRGRARAAARRARDFRSGACRPPRAYVSVLRAQLDEALAGVDALALPTLPEAPLTLRRRGRCARRTALELAWYDRSISPDIPRSRCRSAAGGPAGGIAARRPGRRRRSAVRAGAQLAATLPATQKPRHG